ncbi:MAG: hypothetical protein COA43_08125 [Robiginitomaculum sp.]|nr:MAG: hypothetical protein COA43_08125 [Robiginitomaculum sp.]
MSDTTDHAFDRHWHLATTDHEIALTELEFALFRSFEAFHRWQAEGIATVTGLDLSGTDNAILNIIRMRDRSKSIKEIAMLFNRDDMPNLQYTIRKLTKHGLIEKEGPGQQRKGARYQITAKGLKVLDDYVKIRRSVLVNFSKGMGADFVQATRTLELMSGIYDQAARIAATHRGQIHDSDD